MKFELPYNAKVSIETNHNGNTNIEIEDSYDQLDESLILKILEDKGIQPIIDCLDEDELFEIFNQKENCIDDWTEQKGYHLDKR